MTDGRADTAAIRLALVGIGKIARDQHVPAIAADPRFALEATASRNATLPDVPGFRDLDDLLANGPEVDAVSLCTPPAGRTAIARRAIEAGLHVMLEKPPAATLGELDTLVALAENHGVALFATWHSREAAGVEPARAWLAARRITAVRIAWREDIRRWHPGQEWILGAGGFGVFDPGINALSILTQLLPDPVIVDAATIAIPDGRDSPIAAELEMHSGAVPITAAFDFLQTGPQTWDIDIDTDQGTLKLAMGGSILTLPGEAPQVAADREYPRLYARFADLVAARAIDADAAPLRLVADALLIGARRRADPFIF